MAERVQRVSKTELFAQNNEFFKWSNTTPEKLVADYKMAKEKVQWRKKMGSLIVSYYQHKLSQGYKVNAARSDTVPIRSFLTSQCASAFVKRGAIGGAQPTTGEHEFNLQELRTMFHYADTRGKAPLSTAVALGWSPIDFLSLERAYIKKLIDKALART